MPLLINSLITQKTPEKNRRGRPLRSLIPFLFLCHPFLLLAAISVSTVYCFFFLLISCFFHFHSPLFSTSCPTVPSLQLVRIVSFQLVSASLSSFSVHVSFCSIASYIPGRQQVHHPNKAVL